MQDRKRLEPLSLAALTKPTEEPMSDDYNFQLALTRIGLLIEDTIPDPSEISTEDAVALLVRENNALRMALGLPTYKELAKTEER